MDDGWGMAYVGVESMGKPMRYCTFIDASS
jgi:hypothetical protein